MLGNPEIVPHTDGFNLGVDGNSTVAWFGRFAEIYVLEIFLWDLRRETIIQVIILIDLGFIQANNIKLRYISA